jgi:uncharacterized membrane protein (UPF0127 family)
VLAAAVLVLGGACSDDDSAGDDPAGDDASAGEATGADGGDGEPAPEISLDDLASVSGDASAATGVALDEPPGPAERTGLPGVTETAASITASDGTMTGCCLLVAATDEQRQRGLMEVTDLGGYQGMVFVWDHDTEGGFWMRNTPTPLSIAWFDADGRFVSTTDMAPCSATADDCPTYPPDGPYRFAVEVFEGDLEALGVGPGSRLTLGGPCAEAVPRA